MRTKMFCVFDLKAAVFGVPFFMSKEQMALRSFVDFVNDKTTLISKHPEDFTLYCLGEFDDESGEVFPAKPVVIATAASVKRLDSDMLNGHLIREGQEVS